MADPIRPAFTPLAQTRPSASDAARAAQRAFFSQALAAAQTPAAAPRAQPAAVPAVGAPAVAARAVEPTPPAERIVRPGSLLDIKV